MGDTIKNDSIKKQLRGRREKPVKPKKKKDSVAVKDTIKKHTNGALEDVVTYKAKDSIVFNVKKQQIALHNQTNVKYTDIDITACVEVID